MGRILVADSDPHILLLCQDEFREEGYEVQVAANGQDVLGLLDKDCPDLVVLEIMLPDMSGFETLRIIKGTCRRTAVIFHSTYDLPETGGVPQWDCMVLKTHNLDRLKKAVRRFLPSLNSVKKTQGSRPGSNKSNSCSGVRHGLNGN